MTYGQIRPDVAPGCPEQFDLCVPALTLSPAAVLQADRIHPIGIELEGRNLRGGQQPIVLLARSLGRG